MKSSKSNSTHHQVVTGDDAHVDNRSSRNHPNANDDNGSNNDNNNDLGPYDKIKAFISLTCGIFPSFYLFYLLVQMMHVNNETLFYILHLTLLPLLFLICSTLFFVIWKIVEFLLITAATFLWNTCTKCCAEVRLRWHDSREEIDVEDDGDTFSTTDSTDSTSI